MQGFITNRTRDNVDYCQYLSRKGWANMTERERAEWTGDLFSAELIGYTTPVNLVPTLQSASNGVTLIPRNQYFLARTTKSGSNLCGVSIIGDASKFVGADMTLTIEGITAPSDCTPGIALCWYDSTGYELAHNTTFGQGTWMFTLNSNTNNRAYLAMFVYVHNGGTVVAGRVAQFDRVMLTMGNESKEYVPYTEILPTRATKGAYNYSDLNRIGLIISEISAEWNLGLTTKTNWSRWDNPPDTFFAQLKSNLEALATYCGTTINLPDHFHGLTFEDANNIEMFLEEVSRMLSGEISENP